MLGCDAAAEHRAVNMVMVKSTWWCQGTGLSDSLGGGQSGGGFCHTPLGCSVRRRVVCHIVCSQCCKLVQEAYNKVRDKNREISVHRWSGEERSEPNKDDGGTYSKCVSFMPCAHSTIPLSVPLSVLWRDSFFTIQTTVCIVCVLLSPKSKPRYWRNFCTLQPTANYNVTVFLHHKT